RRAALEAPAPERLADSGAVVHAEFDQVVAAPRRLGPHLERTEARAVLLAPQARPPQARVAAPPQRVPLRAEVEHRAIEATARFDVEVAIERHLGAGFEGLPGRGGIALRLRQAHGDVGRAAEEEPLAIRDPEPAAGQRVPLPRHVEIAPRAPDVAQR